MKRVSKKVFQKVITEWHLFTSLLLAVILPIPVNATESYSIELSNLQQISENEIQFDILLHNTGSPFFINDIQVEISFNQEILPAEVYFCPNETDIIEQSSELLYAPEIITVSEDDTRIILITEKPFQNNVLQKVHVGETLVIARLQLVACYDQARGVFNNTSAYFNLDQYSTKVQKSHVNESNLKQGFGLLLKGGNLTDISTGYVLSNFVFTGKGYWHTKINGSYIHWNNHEKTHSLFANRLPNKNANVLIAGGAFIEKGSSVEILADKKGAGGSLIFAQTEDLLYTLHLQTTCSSSNAMLFNDSFEQIENASVLIPGSEVYFGVYESDECGLFLNWTDQHGTIIAMDNEFGPYIMPAENTTLTANWQDIEKMAFSNTNSNFYQNNTEKKQKIIGPSLTIEPNASVEVETILNRTNTVIPTIHLVAASSDDIPGSLIHGGGEVLAEVACYISRRIEDSAMYSWHMLSSPVADMPVRPEFVPEGIIPAWVDFYKWDEARVHEVDGEQVFGWWVNSKISGGPVEPGF